MRLGINLGPAGAADLARRAEELGYELALVPEGFNSDAASVLGNLAARTTTIKLASGVFQIAARTPVMTAMTTATLDRLSNGRFHLGLGVSNAYVTEGWHGLPYDRPLRRTREYVEIVRAALSREQVTYRGEHFRLPLRPVRGEPFRLLVPGLSKSIPIYLAAVGSRNLELAGEIADGWIGVFCTPDAIAKALTHVHAGRRRASRESGRFEVIPSVPLSVHHDPREAARPIAAHVARFVSLGEREVNVYFSLLERMGYGEAAEKIQDRYRTGDHEGAASAVPLEFVDETSLLGSPGRVAERMRAFARAGTTVLAVSAFARTLGDQLKALQIAAEQLDRMRKGDS
ncbi:LLM class flavin-dependent oxidoreductase [Nonomuraea sp. NPDC059007]|uniref:LLM class flavin-dependent oxidoreductase n=1 Tax=Nonomuraea sp. NPDC059007 TaxID=3346692 RepID=UPI0036955A27